MEAMFRPVGHDLVDGLFNDAVNRFGIDIDGVLLHDQPDDAYYGTPEKIAASFQRLSTMPHIPFPHAIPSTAVYITGRGVEHRQMTEEWLARHGILRQVHMRQATNKDLSIRNEKTEEEWRRCSIRHKAQRLVDLDLTHYIESCALQASMISAELSLMGAGVTVLRYDIFAPPTARFHEVTVEVGLDRQPSFAPSP